jgi:hypothetical protein
MSLYLKDYTGQIETSIYQSQIAMPMLLIDNNLWTFPLVIRLLSYCDKYRVKISLNFYVTFSCAITMATYDGILSLLYILRLFWCPVDKNPTASKNQQPKHVVDKSQLLAASWSILDSCATNFDDLHIGEC